MANISYIKVLQAVELFSKEHLQVKRFASDFPGQMPNFGTETEAYPIVYVSPTETIFNENTSTFQIDVYCFDIIQKDRENINTILSDTNLILSDLHRWLLDGDVYGLDIINTPVAAPIDNALLDYAAGWRMTLILDCSTYGVCEIPFNEVPAILTEINDVVYTKYLTCATLADCDTFTNAIDDLQEQIDNIELIPGPTGATGPKGEVGATGATGIGYLQDLQDVTDQGNITTNAIVITGEGLTADYFQLDIEAAEPIDTGKIVWNSADGTFDMGLLNGVTLQAGQEMHMYAKASGVISNGDAVQFAGAQGDHLLIKKAVPSEINANPEYFVGVATQNFTNNQFGYVTVFGQVRGLDTDDYPEGTVLYYQSGGSTTGLLTDVRPTGPNAKITVAAVVKSHQNQGAIFVRPHVMPRIGALQDVEIYTSLDNQALVYNSTNSIWENKTIIEDAIIDGVTDIAPSQNAVFDALATKQDNLGYTPANLAGDTFTGNIEAPSISLNGVNLESLMIAYAVALG